MEEVQGVRWCVSQEAGFIFEAMGEWRHQLPNMQVLEAEIIGNRKKGQPRKLWKECEKKGLERYDLRREGAHD